MSRVSTWFQNAWPSKIRHYTHRWLSSYASSVGPLALSSLFPVRGHGCRLTLNIPRRNDHRCPVAIVRFPRRLLSAWKEQFIPCIFVPTLKYRSDIQPWSIKRIYSWLFTRRYHSLNYYLFDTSECTIIRISFHLESFHGFVALGQVFHSRSNRIAFFFFFHFSFRPLVFEIKYFSNL